MHYYFLSPVWRAKMDAITISGATVNRIPLTKFPDTEVSFPELNEQVAIADTLAAYDDLIENNRQRIALLEEAARLLYREWFVHFRFPGHEDVKITDDLPEGWEYRAVGQIADLKYGKSLKQENRIKGPFPVYGSSGIVGYHEAALAIEDAIRALTDYDISRSTVQHNREFYRLVRSGVPEEYRDAQGRRKSARARAIDFDNAPGSNRFLAVRELKLTGVRTPNYNRRADLVCFVNGLPLVFIELKAVYRNIREGFDNNLSDYMDETGFDVECLSTLYLDKPMKAHSLMQAIARANRVWPGKDFGLIVDYNGMLKSLREALAQYALGDDGEGGEEIVAPVEERVQALIEAIEATEAHLRGLGFDPATLIGSTGFTRIKGLRDAVEVVYTRVWQQAVRGEFAMAA